MGALIAALLDFKHISHSDVAIIVKRRFPASKLTARRVRAMAHALQASP